MAEYKAFINENGNQRMAEITTVIRENPAVAAEIIISDKNVRDGANVTIAELVFDYPTQSFKAQSYTFDVVDGRADNLRII